MHSFVVASSLQFSDFDRLVSAVVGHQIIHNSTGISFLPVHKNLSEDYSSTSHIYIAAREDFSLVDPYFIASVYFSLSFYEENRIKYSRPVVIRLKI